ncbi:MAG: hypothetical protein IPG71_01305 [bacterium]|nr:hypothetical protein [bacterium]
MPERFQKSAVSALGFLSNLLENAGQDAGRLAAPELLELLTLCRETNLRLPILEVYGRVCDRPPALTLLGGDAQLASDLAHCVGLRAELEVVPEMPMLWWIEAGSQDRTFVQSADAFHEVDADALHNLLYTALPLDRATVLKREVVSDSQWRFAWLPDLTGLALHADRAAVLEPLIASQTMIFVGDELPQAFMPWFSRPGLITRQFAGTEIIREDVRPKLYSELFTLRDTSFAEQQAVHAATWHFVLPKLVEALDSLRQQYTLDIDRQNMKLQTTRQMLGEYPLNWAGGVRNIVDDYFTKKVTGPAMAALLDPRQTGPQPGTFIQALSLPTLWKRLHELLTDRMAEFVQGLSALATRVELRSISLKEVEVRWSPNALAAAIEEELTLKKVFAEGGGERSGLVGSLMGRKEEIISNRKTQMARANKIAQNLIEQDFLQWSERILHTVEQRVRVQIAAVQANQGMPDIETLRTALTGIDRLTALLEGNREGTVVEPPKRIGALLSSWAARRWIRRYAPAV